MFLRWRRSLPTEKARRPAPVRMTARTAGRTAIVSRISVRRAPIAVVIALMACLLGAQRGYEMHVVDLAQAGQKRDLVEDLGARYHSGDAVGRSAARRLASGGIMCLTGIMNLDPALDVDATALNRNMVLRNQVLVGAVNEAGVTGNKLPKRSQPPTLAGRAG